MRSFLVLLLFFCFFLFLHTRTSVFIGSDDSYYHARHSQLVGASHRFTIVEPWVTKHFFSSAPVDPYVLSHFLSGLVIRSTDILFGTKLVTAFMAASIFAVFYIIVRPDTKRPLWWTLLFFASSLAFSARILFERPFVFSIALFLLVWFLAQQKRYWLLFSLMILYMLFYNLAPIALLIAVAHLCSQKLLYEPTTLKPFIAIVGGIVVGLLLHPHTLNYISLIFVHFVTIATVKIQGIPLQSGLEIEPYSIVTFIQKNIIALMLYIIGTVFTTLLWLDKKITLKILSLFLLSAAWCVVAIAVPRGVEYWVPLAVLLAVYTFNNPHIQQVYLRPLNRFVPHSIRRPILLVALLLLIISQYVSLSRFILLSEKTTDLADYEAVAVYLQQHTDPNSVIFYPVWAMFPKMFYTNTHNRYITAFDPIFLYDYNQETYWIWYNLTNTFTYCAHTPPCLKDESRDQGTLVRTVLDHVFDTNTIVVYTIDPFYTFLKEYPSAFETVYKHGQLAIIQSKK